MKEIIKAENQVGIRTSAAIRTKHLDRESKWNIIVEGQVMSEHNGIKKHAKMWMHHGAVAL